MRRPVWSHWWQLRDIAPVIISALVLCAFLYACTVAAGHLVIGFMTSFADHWNHPS